MSKCNQDITKMRQIFTDLKKEYGVGQDSSLSLDKESINHSFREMMLEIEQKERADKVLKELFREFAWKENTSEAVSSVMDEQEYKKKEYKRLKSQYKEAYKQEQEEKFAEAVDEVLFEIEEKEDGIRWKRYKKTTVRRLKTTVALMATVALLLAVGYAWYSRYNKHADTASLQIMTPYTLYLLNSDKSDVLELQVGGIHPGETKQIVVCVSSHDANGVQTSKDGTFPYSLELVYTQNIGLEYSLYPLTVTTANDDDENKITSYYTTVEAGATTQKPVYFVKGTELVKSTTDYTSEYVAQMYSQHSDKLSEIVNKGKYDVYTEYTDGDEDAANNEKFKLSLSDETSSYNYFLIEINWQDSQNASSKETDLVYLVAKAGVPKPVEVTENTTEVTTEAATEES